MGSVITAGNYQMQALIGFCRGHFEDLTKAPGFIDIELTEEDFFTKPEAGWARVEDGDIRARWFSDDRQEEAIIMVFLEERETVLRFTIIWEGKNISQPLDDILKLFRDIIATTGLELMETREDDPTAKKMINALEGSYGLGHFRQIMNLAAIEASESGLFPMPYVEDIPPGVMIDYQVKKM